MEIKSLLPSIFTGSSDRDPFRALQRQIDQVFSDFSRDLPSVGWTRNGSLNLAVDVVETDKTLEVTADLPGVDEKDISVTLAGDTLMIKAEKKTEKEEKGKDYHVSERSYGMFERSMDLPFKPESSKVDAKFEKGVLKVTINKPAEVQTLTQKIPVKAAA
jgi:HSP20 family protein